MNNRKQIFNFFKNIINYEGDISKLICKKNNFIPVINNKKNTYSTSKHANNKNNFLVKILILQIIILIIVLIVFIILKK